VLQDSLGGNSKTLMIAAISSADVNKEESQCAAAMDNAKHRAARHDKPVVRVLGGARDGSAV